MHHAKVVIRLLAWIRFLENSSKIISKFTQLEETFNFFIFRHGLALLGKQTRLDNGLLNFREPASGEAG